MKSPRTGNVSLTTSGMFPIDVTEYVGGNATEWEFATGNPSGMVVLGHNGTANSAVFHATVTCVTATP